MLVIDQPDGKYLIFGTISDTIQGKDLTKEQVEQFFIDYAIDRAKFENEMMWEQREKGWGKPDMKYKEALKTHLKTKNCNDEDFNASVRADLERLK
jgi:hypothetical protein